MPSFQFQNRYALFTYPQCGDLDPFAVSDHFSEMGAECIVAREAHADGGTHLHAFVDFGRKYRTRRVDAFDVAGQHPNVSPSHGTPAKGYDYAIKDGEVCAGGLARPTEKSLGKAIDRWAEIISADSRDEFFERVRVFDPRALCTSFTQLSKYADWQYRVDPEPYRHPEGFTFNLSGFPELVDWTHESLSVDRRVGKISFYF